MHTLNGHLITVGSSQAPTLRELAQLLARQARWNGATIRPWSVLQHQLLCMEVAQQRKYSHFAVLACGVHDLEEAITGDIPRPVKTDQQSAFGEDVRRWLYKATLQLPYPEPDVIALVKDIDDEVLHAEAECLCHPRIRAALHGEPAWVSQCDTLFEMVDMSEREQVHAYVTWIEALQTWPEIRRLKERM
jgi:hypothetical protein